jgi:hypothetical protein
MVLRAGSALSADNDIKKHIVAYFDPNSTQISGIANSFDLVVGIPEDANSIHAIDSSVDVLFYRSMSTMSATVDATEWAEVTTHDDWFVHDEYLLNHRTGHWTLDESSGSTVGDSATPAHSGTLQLGSTATSTANLGD